MNKRYWIDGRGRCDLGLNWFAGRGFGGFRCGEDGAEADDDPDEVERDGGPGASFPTAKGEECSSDDVDPVESSRLASEPSAGNQHVSQQQCASSNPTAQLTNQRWTRTSLRDSERMDN